MHVFSVIECILLFDNIQASSESPRYSPCTLTPSAVLTLVISLVSSLITLTHFPFPIPTPPAGASPSSPPTGSRPSQ